MNLASKRKVGGGGKRRKKKRRPTAWLLNGYDEAGEDANVFWSWPRGRCHGHTRRHVTKARQTVHNYDIGKQLSPVTL